MRRAALRACLPLALSLAALSPAPALSATASAASGGGRAGVEERGKAQVTWTRIEAPPGDDQARIQKLLRKLLDKAVKKADFGRAHEVSASVRVAELSSVEHDGVLRVSCTLVGKIEGGQRAKARISFGGDPAKARDLELEVLTMVANGLVTRLAVLSHERAKDER